MAWHQLRLHAVGNHRFDTSSCRFAATAAAAAAELEAAGEIPAYFREPQADEQAAQEEVTENLPNEAAQAEKVEHDGGVVEWVAAPPAPAAEPEELQAALEPEPEPESKPEEAELEEQEQGLKTGASEQELEPGEPEDLESEPEPEPGPEPEALEDAPELEQELELQVQRQDEVQESREPRRELQLEALEQEAESKAPENEPSEVQGQDRPEQPVLNLAEETQSPVEPDLDSQAEESLARCPPPVAGLSPPEELAQPDAVSPGTDYKSQLQNLLSEFQASPYDSDVHDEEVEEDDECLRKRDLKQRLLRGEAPAPALRHERDSPTPAPEEQAEEGRALALLERDPTAAYNTFAEVGNSNTLAFFEKSR